jgi:hypothetical protein
VQQVRLEKDGRSCVCNLILITSIGVTITEVITAPVQADINFSIVVLLLLLDMYKIENKKKKSDKLSKKREKKRRIEEIENEKWTNHFKIQSKQTHTNIHSFFFALFLL